MARNGHWGSGHSLSMGLRLCVDLIVVALFTIAAVLITGGGSTSAFVGAIVGMFVAEAFSRSLRDKRISN